MHPDDVARATDAARSIATSLGLRADDASVLHSSNKLALHLGPCDVVARVAHEGQEVASFEVELAQRLEETGCPAGRLDPRVEPRVHTRDGFTVTLWTSYRTIAPQVAPADYAEGLERLHAGMRRIEVACPSFEDRVEEAQVLVGDPTLTPDLAAADRELLRATLAGLRRTLGGRGAGQLIHGEPHPGNVLSTEDGPRFIDLETCCRGPVELDLAHVPEAVSRRYPGIDQRLLRECRHLVLAMVAAWRWDRDDQFPDRERARGYLLRALRAGPPWATLDELVGRPPGP